MGITTEYIEVQDFVCEVAGPGGRGLGLGLGPGFHTSVSIPDSLHTLCSLQHNLYTCNTIYCGRGPLI